MKVYNSLTLEEIVKLAIVGFTFEISDGQITAIRLEDAVDG